MWVYGDQERRVSLADLLAELHAAGDALAGAAPGLAWHSACTRLFLTLSDLLQGLADEEMRAHGHDEVSPVQDGLGAALVAVATSLARSWESGLADQRAPAVALPASLADWDNLVLIVRRCEGYAFYALYPELILRAARDLPKGPVSIGLRSIGGGLAALAAATSGARALITLRPRGDPFRRQIAAGPLLRRRIADHRDSAFAVVDEGPGLSGSSFGATADWLESEGVDPARIHFMPSHAGDPGPQGQAAHRESWHARPRHVASFDEVIVDGPVPLARWFEDLTGPAIAPLRDLSGGAWRSVSPWPEAPSDPGREMRKYRLGTERGFFLLKFAGLDAASDAKLQRARALFEAGLSSEPLALRHGFLLERWVDGHRPTQAPLAYLGPYLRFRAGAFPAERPGAPLERLVEMARHNAREALGSAADRAFAPWTRAALESLQGAGVPVQVDGRLHPWEWLETEGRILKTDAVDHAEAHDLVGCQDIGWDVAGAAIEFSLTPAEEQALAARLMWGRPPALLPCLRLCYLGFQLGWWSYAGESGAGHRDHYLRVLERLSG